VVRRRVRLSQVGDGDGGGPAGVWLEGGAQVHIASSRHVANDRVAVDLVSAHLVVTGEIPAMELSEVWETSKTSDASLVRTVLAAGTTVRGGAAANAPTLAVLSNRNTASVLSEAGTSAFVEINVDGATVKGFVDRTACRDTSTGESSPFGTNAFRQSYPPSSPPAAGGPSHVLGTAVALVPKRSCLFGALDAEIVGVSTAATSLPVTYFPVHGGWWLTDVQTEIGPVRVMLRDIANARTPDTAQWELCSN
jgi:hypothetical protein